MALLRRFVYKGILACHRKGSIACVNWAQMEESFERIQVHCTLVYSIVQLPALQIGILFPILVLDDPIQVARRVPPKIRYVEINHIRRHKIKDRVFHLHFL
jgi:hypothetical protein